MSITLERWLRGRTAATPGLVLSPDAEVSIADAPRPRDALDLLVGPEGGFAPEEIAQAAARRDDGRASRAARAAHRNRGAGVAGGDQRDVGRLPLSVYDRRTVLTLVRHRGDDAFRLNRPHRPFASCIVRTPIDATPEDDPMSRTLLVMPDDTSKPLLAAIDGATKSLRVKMFTFSDPGLIQAVIARAKRGVDVRVMLNAARRSGEAENEETRKTLARAA